MTYLTKEDWEKNFVQKIREDKSFFAFISESKKIFSEFSYLIQKIFNFKEKEKLPKKICFRVLFSSLIFFHKYILSNGISFFDLSPTEKLCIYSACIFISFKTINKLIPVEVFSSKYLDLFNKNKKIKFKKEEINELIKKKEFEILFSIQFQINIDCPYDYFYLIKKYLTHIKIPNEEIKKVINFVNVKINEIMMIPMYLYYTPFEMVISVLSIIKEEYKINYINLNDFVKMHNLDIDKNNINACVELINKINQNNTNNIIKPIKSEGELDKINFNMISSIQTNK